MLPPRPLPTCSPLSLCSVKALARLSGPGWASEPTPHGADGEVKPRAERAWPRSQSQGGWTSLGRQCCSPGVSQPTAREREELRHTALSLGVWALPCGGGTIPLSRILASHSGRIPFRPGPHGLSCSPPQVSDRRDCFPSLLCLHTSPAWGRRSVCPGSSSCRLPQGQEGLGCRASPGFSSPWTGQGAGVFPCLSPGTGG